MWKLLHVDAMNPRCHTTTLFILSLTITTPATITYAPQPSATVCQVTLLYSQLVSRQHSSFCVNSVLNLRKITQDQISADVAYLRLLLFVIQETFHCIYCHRNESNIRVSINTLSGRRLHYSLCGTAWIEASFMTHCGKIHNPRAWHSNGSNSSTRLTKQ